MESIDILDLKYDPVQYNRLLKHLKSADFFNIEKFPKAQFELLSAEPMKKDTLFTDRSDIAVIEPTHIVKGNLTIKDNTQEITFPVRFDIRNLKLEISAKFDLRKAGWKTQLRNPGSPSDTDMILNIRSLGFEIISFSEEY
jgi:polyisoprenoid-binding protein YceI